MLYIGHNKTYYAILDKSYLGLSNYFLSVHRYDSTVENLLNGLEIAKAINDTSVFIDLNQNYALVYSQLSLPKLAIEYDNAALNYIQKNNNGMTSMCPFIVSMRFSSSSGLKALNTFNAFGSASFAIDVSPLLIKGERVAKMILYIYNVYLYSDKNLKSGLRPLTISASLNSFV